MPRKRTILFVDGYNVLNARQGAKGWNAAARDGLIEGLRDYAGATGVSVVVVFDAWMSDRKTRTVEDMGGLSVVFTQRGETADQYIERKCDEYAEKVALDLLEVRIATNDLVEQTVALGRGAIRVSARELLADMEQSASNVRQMQKERSVRKSTIMDALPEGIAEKLERMRRGE